MGSRGCCGILALFVAHFQKKALELPYYSMQQLPSIVNRSGPPPKGQPVNVVAFGAVGDGKTDCTTAVREAVAYIHSQRKGAGAEVQPVPALIFPAGRFILKAPLHVDCFTVEGAGPTTTQLIFSNTSKGTTCSFCMRIIVEIKFSNFKALLRSQSGIIGYNVLSKKTPEPKVPTTTEPAGGDANQRKLLQADKRLY